MTRSLVIKATSWFLVSSLSCCSSAVFGQIGGASWLDGKMVDSITVGESNRETKSPITRQTTFRMASVSKQFTAMAVLLLDQEGKLQLTDPIDKYLPELKPSLGHEVKIQHLLTHTSGLPDYESLMQNDWQGQISDQQVLELLRAQDKLYFKPGSEFKYSNTGFCLLAVIVERVSEIPYRRFMEERIFEPLGMESTFMYDASNPVADRAMGYARKGTDGELVPSDQSATSATLGDGCVYTSIDDYRKWYVALRANKLVNFSKVLEEVAIDIPQQPGVRYGLGWFVYRDPETGKVELTHTGSTCGFSNIVIASLSDDKLVAVFSNIAGEHDRLVPVMNKLTGESQLGFQVDWKKVHGLTD